MSGRGISGAKNVYIVQSALSNFIATLMTLLDTKRYVNRIIWSKQGLSQIANKRFTLVVLNPKKGNRFTLIRSYLLAT